MTNYSSQDYWVEGYRKWRETQPIKETPKGFGRPYLSKNSLAWAEWRRREGMNLWITKHIKQFENIDKEKLNWRDRPVRILLRKARLDLAYSANYQNQDLFCSLMKNYRRYIKVPEVIIPEPNRCLACGSLTVACKCIFSVLHS